MLLTTLEIIAYTVIYNSVNITAPYAIYGCLMTKCHIIAVHVDSAVSEAEKTSNTAFNVTCVLTLNHSITTIAKVINTRQPVPYATKICSQADLPAMKCHVVILFTGIVMKITSNMTLDVPSVKRRLNYLKICWNSGIK